MKKVVVLASGRGSNFEAIATQCARQQWPARIVAVVTDQPQAPVLERAQALGIPSEVVARARFDQRDVFDAALATAIDAHGPDLVVLAGFMRVLGDAFVQHYAGRLLNIHPSLLPAFPGLHSHRRALAAGVRIHGATVHFVVPEVDSGPIVAQAALAVHDDDTEQTLDDRVLQLEHRIYPMAVRWFVEDRLSVCEGRVLVAERPAGRADNELRLLLAET